MVDSVPIPAVDPEVRDALSGLTGPDEVVTVRNLRRLAHLTRLAYEAFLDEGFSDAQAMALVGRLASSDLEKMDPSYSPPVDPFRSPIVSPFITPNAPLLPYGVTTTISGQILPRVSPTSNSTVVSTQ